MRKAGNAAGFDDAARAAFRKRGKLARNWLREREALGLPVSIPAGWDVHHIISKGHRSAQELRALLKRFNIDIDDAAKAVILPGPRATELGNAVYHPRLHSGKYFDELTNRLRDVASREEVLEVLRDTARDLDAGLFPYRK